MMLTATFETKVREALAREYPGLALVDWSIRSKAEVVTYQCYPVGGPRRFSRPYGRYEVTMTLEEAPPSVVAAMVVEAGAK